MTNTEIAIGTALLLIVSNSIGFVYSFLALYSNLFKSFRIQNKSYEPGIMKARLPLYLFNLFILVCLSGGSMFFLGGLFNVGIPTWYVFVGQVLFVFLIDDVWFYFAHRYMHENKFLLRNIHSIHHRASTPFPLEYLYVHPFEWMIGMLGTAIGFGLIFIFMPVNIFAFWAFGLLRNLHEIHIHSGLNVKYLNWIPFISSTENHDIHHAKLNGNYSSTFTFWDGVFKTKFKEHAN